MTLSSEQSGDDSYSNWGGIFHRHYGKAVRVLIWILAALCVALLINIICVASSPPKSNIVGHGYHSPEPVEERNVNTSEPDLVQSQCKVHDCRVQCQNTTRIYHDVFRALQATCEKNINLEIYSQRFPKLTLSNRWIPTNKIVKDISIINGNFTHIRNEAFNCIDFTKTESLMLAGVNVLTLSNGVLLGLSNLQSLRIIGRVEEIDRCFFQPVQSSLTRLKLNAYLTISGNKNVFGISTLPGIVALDLSDNVISGSLTRKFFSPVPNVKCVTLSNSRIMSIDEDSFEDIAEGLHLLDLSKNLLTVIDERLIERLLIMGRINVYLSGNSWHCDCELQPLIHLYDSYEERFADIPYCQGPLALYGVLFTNVTFGSECSSKNEEKPILETSTTQGMVNTESTLLVGSTPAESATEANSTEGLTSHPMLPFQMRCLSVVDVASDEGSSNAEQMEYFLFAPPCHEFELVLLDNNSAHVFVELANEPINIVWFSEAIENFAYTIDGITVDYNCEAYTDPYLLIDNLQENTTYTFCLVPSGLYSITPFNCLPLHVPFRIDASNVWISNDEKQVTLGLVSLIFTCSMILGGVVAYFGIKAYPDLLEGSRHVLVVKKSDQTCYVSTITEGDYMMNQGIRKSSLEKKKMSLSCCQLDPQIDSFSVLPRAISIPTLSKQCRESTEQFVEDTEDHYELPYVQNKPHDCTVQCIPNKYATSPVSPPPLPKRNSDSMSQNEFQVVPK